MKVAEAIARCQKCPVNLFRRGGYCAAWEHRRAHVISRNAIVYTGELVPITDVDECPGGLAEGPLPVMAVNGRWQR